MWNEWENCGHGRESNPTSSAIAAAALTSELQTIPMAYWNYYWCDFPFKQWIMQIWIVFWISMTINSFLYHGYLHSWSISPPVRAPQRVHDNYRKCRGLTSRAIDPSMYARRRPSFKLGEHILDTFVLALIDEIYKYIPWYIPGIAECRANSTKA